MAIDLKKILATMKKTYSFKVKLAAEVQDSDLSGLDTILKLKGMISRSKPEALPLSAAPTDFARLKGFFGTIYKFNMDFEYPITPNQIVNEISTQLGLDRAYIIVRTAESPLEQADDNYLKYKDELEKLYLSAFPKEERFPFWILEECSKEDNSDLYVVLDNDKFVGICYIVNCDGAYYLMYLAVQEELRNKRYTKVEN